jgi:alpha-galactosidase
MFQGDRLDVLLLRGQLAVAREIGCEVFVVDAGWFGPGGPGWWDQAGDWREKTSDAFHGAMGDFADEVRAAGLGFGLWMEPERFATGAPVRGEHPEWFLPAQDDLARIDLENPEAYRYLRGEIGRLVETYRLAWMKIDSNFELGDDSTGAELHGYYTRWFALLDDLRAAYPETFFEGCAAGGMRLELNMLAHFDAHFLSDTVNPVDTLRILQGALLRVPPGRISRWAVLRPARVPAHGGAGAAQWEDTIITLGGAGGTPFESVNVDFALLAALPGAFGLSGDLAGLAAHAVARVRWATRFYKDWRGLIDRSVAHLLTPPKPIEDRWGWAALQLQDPLGGDSLVFVYRLDDPRGLGVFPLRGLEADAAYQVFREDNPDRPEFTATGRQLMGHGLEAHLAAPGRGAVYSVRRVGDAAAPVSHPHQRRASAGPVLRRGDAKALRL